MGYGRHLPAISKGPGGAKLFSAQAKRTRGSTKLKLVPIQSGSSPAKSTPSPTKHTKSQSNHHTANDELDWEDIGAYVPIPPASSKPHTKTSQDYMQEWLPKRQNYLDVLLGNEAPPVALDCFRCGSVGGTTWRCKDCVSTFRQPFCLTCMRETHFAVPFHRVEVYHPKKYFQASWLWKVGVYVKVGSCSGKDSCTSSSSTSDDTFGSNMPDSGNAANWTDHDDFSFGAKPAGRYHNAMKVLTVVHTNGVHHLPFRFCRCSDTFPEDAQLLHAGFYPSTYTDVRTVFTFSLLNDYNLSTLECFTSTHHFYAKLRRLTNKAFPGSVPDRTRELRRAGRQWRSLKEWRRCGMGHTGKVPQKGDLALFCAGCPQPGVNLPDDWEEDPEQWKFTRSFVGDGNMTCVHRSRPGQSDVYIKDGEGYMTAREPYGEHIRTTVEVKEKRTCHEHRAVSDKSKIHKGCDATGIGAWACMRHGCFCPGGVVDFQKGERQMNMDYALSESLENTCPDGTSRIILAYDINCQYSIHLKTRMKKGQYLRLRDNLLFVYGIGLFHVHGHKDSCHPRYALTFIRGAGVASGEILESLWAVVNEVARTTATMTMAHRLEVLDAIFGDSNWKKMLNLVPALCKNWSNSRLELARAEEDFELLDETASPEQRLQWQFQLDQAHKMREKHPERPTSMDILNVQLDRPPTQARVQHDLMAKEQTSNTGLGVTSWVVFGLKIQENHEVREQCKGFIKDLDQVLTDAQALEVTKRREQLQTDINTFYDTAAALFPDADFKEIQCDNPPDEPAHIDGSDDLNISPSPQANPFSLLHNDAENVTLPLPSSFPSETPPSMQGAHGCELELRIAQLNDCLEKVRTDIGHKSFLYRSSVRLAEGKKGKTRGYTAISNVDQHMRLNIKIYHKSRWALSRLGAEQSVMNRYRRITKSDTKAITAIYQPNARGQRNKSLSWIWTTDVQGDSARSAYLAELYRVNWIKAKCRAERWKEEHILLSAEMEWVLNFFESQQDKCKAWANLTRDRPGHYAYARRKSDMWRLLGVHAEGMFDKTRRRIEK
ncbi:hypothetical protein BKA70DRAFT_1372112 [Coprinopsis sp. MPI-PUGE-AT-0042]|nr:hypothetical protein BKA70DRAFT_1372112 [Coprinopsis sp. MPI-PUGE-AT-0042]